LPLAADAVTHHEVDLRAVERRFAPLLGVVHAARLHQPDQGRLGPVPVSGVAVVLVAGRVAQADANAVVVEAQALQDEQHQVQVGAELGLDLLRGDEQVGVVLGEAAHPGHAGQLPAFLKTVDGAELREAHRQVAVAARLGLVDLDVMRAVHRLEQVLLLRLKPLC
jgi:hypothetical protein